MHIIGHRGARGEAPENTLGGFLFALNRGVTRFELDLQLAADGVPVVIHDILTRRTTRSLRAVAFSNSTTLANLNAASGQEWPQTERVPTLKELLPVLDRCDAVQLEIKRDLPNRHVRMLRSLKEILKNSDPQRYTITSSDVTALLLASQILPEFHRGVVCQYQFVDNVTLAERMGCSLMVIDHHLVTRRLVIEARAARRQVSCYTVNQLSEIQRLKSWGVHSVITDFPVRFLYLDSHAAKR